MIEIRKAGPSDWEASKAISLRALADTPEAFASTLEHEAAFDDKAWTRRNQGAHQLLAWDGDEPCRHGHRPRRTGRWSRCGSRRSSARHRASPTGMVEELAVWAKAAGLAAGLRAGVADGNDAARALYDRTGFVETGETAVMRDGIGETRMSRAL